MYGQDIERILSKLEELKDTTHNKINEFAGETSYRLECIAEHAGTAFGQCIPLEKEHPASNPMGDIMNKYSSLEDDVGKLQSMGDSLYVDKTEFNNSVGSPFKEFEKLKEVLRVANDYASSNNPFNWLSQKASMLALLNTIIPYCNDCKYAITLYSDYVQRGYDHKYNGDEPSLTWKYSLDDDTMGNLFQDYDENVNIKKKKDYDIY